MEETYTFCTKSSCGDPYLVTFNFSDGRMKVVCNCIAGGFAQMCKHKDGLINGDVEVLFDRADEDICRKVCEIIKTTRYFAEFDILQEQLNEIEKQKKDLSTQAKNLKSDFGKRLRDGI
jgi:hypothetical protein